MNDVKEFIEKNKIGKLMHDVDMKKYTSYRTGGKARLMVFPKNEKMLIKLLKYLRDNKVKNKILGNGSNTLFSDEVYEGVIVKLYAFNKIMSCISPA